MKTSLNAFVYQVVITRQLAQLWMSSSVYVILSAENCCTNSLFVKFVTESTVTSNLLLIYMEELGSDINFFHEFLVTASVTLSNAITTVSTTLIMSNLFGKFCIIKVDCVTKSL